MPISPRHYKRITPPPGKQMQLLKRPGTTKVSSYIDNGLTKSPMMATRGPWPPCGLKHGAPEAMEQQPRLPPMGSHADPMSTRGAWMPYPGDTRRIGPGYLS